MARKKKTRRVSDIMPARKVDKKVELPKGKPGKKLTRYELDAKAREDKKKKKRKGLASGSRHSATENNNKHQALEKKDPRIGSRKKVPLVVEFVNKPEKGMTIPPMKLEEKLPKQDPMLELELLESNECLNQLLDDLEAGKTLSAEDQQFVDDCLDRIAELMDELGISEDDDPEEDLLRTFEKIDINQFR
ncbi:TPA: Der GTPase-activating protein YihI [Pasteurella multocida]|uniref:Der GTPase-activating protein YihI n=1 Tax=Pasteurella multocida TaxID=747 RepID=UPI000233FB69|nr:Der GTPase-activating protein YihI [Pasteurella multocida]AWW60286.1 Der GTPase-activating protein YihI [Pasteurellaceae bacterium 12591]AET16377.1 Der GTPase activator [Pasteurella multocida 36950]AIN48980.1 der GTPase activator family protein [Pasteurella multocida]ANJ90697.1 GTPase activator [Pasteurella multocida subsp. multocida HB01]AON59177.1 GTPase-activating protein [Pasteurella multocida]